MRYPSLAKAIMYGKLTDVQAWVDLGEDINDFDEYGFTPLIEAVIFQKNEVVNYLLEKGADPNFKSLPGHTPLHWAVEVGNLELCEALLKNGANPNAYSRGSQPILVLPVLRHRNDIKNLLYKYGGDLHFAQDFIQAKLLAHRYELIGPVDIVTHERHFVELDMEGFFLEFTLNVIPNSLIRFKNSFAARHLRGYFGYIEQIVNAFHNAAELIRYQHFTQDYQQHQSRIDKLLSNKLLLLPVGYEGHAITFINYADILVKCDRGEWGRENGSVVIYRMTKPHAFNKNFIKNLIYKKQSKEAILEWLPEQLGLVPLTQLPIPPQITGNCSWANTEAAVAVMTFILLMAETTNHNPDTVIAAKQNALSFYRQWTGWDKATALSECLQSLDGINPQRKAAKLMQLAALMFQKLRHSRLPDIRTAQKLLPYLTDPDYIYILQSYKERFYLRKRSPQGINLIQLIEAAGFYV
jgi:hypothetical protein